MKTETFEVEMNVRVRVLVPDVRVRDEGERGRYEAATDAAVNFMSARIEREIFRPTVMGMDMSGYPEFSIVEVSPDLSLPSYEVTDVEGEPVLNK